MSNEDNLRCNFCNNGKSVVSVVESNRNFIIARIKERNLDEAITISRIAWDNFPVLKESADTKKIVESLLKGVQEVINTQLLTPITTSTNAITTSTNGLAALRTTLERLAEQNPNLIEKSVKDQFKVIEGNLKVLEANIKSSFPTSQVQQTYQMLLQLLNKPTEMGSVGQTILSERWTEAFPKDKIEEIGGAGKEDLFVIPYLNNSIGNYGEAISLERKAGEQRYSGSHLGKAIQHARDMGRSYAMIVYDTQRNLPQKTMIAKEHGVLVAAVDLESGMWKVAREVFIVLQEELNVSKKQINEVDIEAIKDVLGRIGQLKNMVDGVRGKNSKVQTISKLRQV